MRCCVGESKGLDFLVKWTHSHIFELQANICGSGLRKHLQTGQPLGILLTCGVGKRGLHAEGVGRSGHALKLPLLTCLSRPFLGVLLLLFLEERGDVREYEVLFQALCMQLFSPSPLACSRCYIISTPPAFFGADIIAQSLGGRRAAPSDKILFMHEEADISHKNVGLHRHALHRLRMKQASS